MTDTEGHFLGDGGGGGYKYFGAAKNLPGVRELFEEKHTMKRRKTRKELIKGLDSDYYGLRDEDDGVLVRVEAKAEKVLVAEMEAAWAREAPIRAARRPTAKTTAKAAEEANPTDEGFVAFVPLPDDKDIEARVVAKKKNELLAKYQSESLMTESEHTGTLLGQKL